MLLSMMKDYKDSCDPKTVTLSKYFIFEVEERLLKYGQTFQIFHQARLRALHLSALLKKMIFTKSLARPIFATQKLIFFDFIFDIK